MKQFLFIAMLILLGKTSFAQPGNTDLHVPPHVCSDMVITMYAVEAGTCSPIIGTTIAFTVSPGIPQNYFPPYTGIWAVGGDPAVNCPGCVWEWIAADVSTDPACHTTPTGSPTCGNWDKTTVGMPHCGYTPHDCITYSGACGGCIPGDIRIVDFHPHGVNAH